MTKAIVLHKDLLAAVANDRFSSTPADYVQESLFVMNDMLADDLLILFQKKQRHLAIVHDENKKLEGVVSLEDVLEELVPFDTKLQSNFTQGERLGASQQSFIKGDQVDVAKQSRVYRAANFLTLLARSVI